MRIIQLTVLLVGLLGGSIRVSAAERTSETVRGIAGVFIYSSKPENLANWYKEHLGIETEILDDGTYYKVFQHRELADPSKKRTTTWALIPAKVKLEGTPRTGMLGYRIDDLAAMLTALKAKGIKIEKTEEYPDLGKYAWIKDCEGNEIMLFEDLSK